MQIVVGNKKVSSIVQIRSRIPETLGRAHSRRVVRRSRMKLPRRSWGPHQGTEAQRAIRLWKISLGFRVYNESRNVFNYLDELSTGSPVRGSIVTST
jgi:hypothetical protein